MNKNKLTTLAIRTALAASKDFTADHGYTWNDKRRSANGESVMRIIEALPVTEIHDYCRDAAWDVLAAADVDFDEHGDDVTDAALSELTY